MTYLNYVKSHLEGGRLFDYLQDVEELNLGPSNTNPLWWQGGELEPNHLANAHGLQIKQAPAVLSFWLSCFVFVGVWEMEGSQGVGRKIAKDDLPEPKT